jgi:hypothetical protein
VLVVASVEALAKVISEVKPLEKAEVDENNKENESSINGESSDVSSQIQSEEMETAGSRDIEQTLSEMDQKFEELLRVIREETLQLSEFLIEEKRLIHELCVLLKLTLKQLNASFRVSAKMIPLSEGIKHVILNEEGHLILVNDKGEVSSKALEDYPPEVILNVLWVVLPELSEMIVSYRKRISFRVNIFEKISREFKNLHKIFSKREEGQAGESSGEVSEDEAQKDGVRQSLLSKK